MKGKIIHTNIKGNTIRRNDDGTYSFIRHIVETNEEVKKQAGENDREEMIKEIEEELELERRLYENINDDDDYDCLPFD